MSDALTLQINGVSRKVDELRDGSPLPALLQTLGLKPDRIAIEHNGDIAARSGWDDLRLHNGDRLEIVHFVGGGVGMLRQAVVALRSRASQRFP